MPSSSVSTGVSAEDVLAGGSSSLAAKSCDKWSRDAAGAAIGGVVNEGNAESERGAGRVGAAGWKTGGASGKGAGGEEGGRGGRREGRARRELVARRAAGPGGKYRRLGARSLVTATTRLAAMRASAKVRQRPGTVSDRANLVEGKWAVSTFRLESCVRAGQRCFAAACWDLPPPPLASRAMPRADESAARPRRGSCA